MLNQLYKYSEKRQELKPIGKDSKIHSIRFGEYNPRLLFINVVGDKNTKPEAVTRFTVPGGTRVEFTYKGTRYTFTLPAVVKRGQTISIEKIMYTSTRSE